MNKLTFYRAVILVFILILLTSFFYIGSISEKYSALETKYNALSIDYAHSEKSMDSLKEKLDSTELDNVSKKNIIASDLEFYKSLSYEKDLLLQSLYKDKRAEMMRDNPIDEFMAVHPLGAINTSALLNNDYIYLNLWKRELTHAYGELKQMTHPFFDDYVDESLASIIDFANSEGEVAVALINIETSNRESGDEDDCFDHRAMDKAIRTWKIATIYKEQTYKLHNFIKETGREIDFVFDTVEFMNESEGLYLAKEYFETYYNVHRTNDGFRIELVDNESKVIHEIFSDSMPEIYMISHFDFLIQITTDGDTTYIYNYNIASKELSEPFMNPLYINNEFIVHTDESSIIITARESSMSNGIMIERDWASVPVLKQAIKNVEIYGDVLAITYLKGVDYTKVTEYIKLNKQ